MSLNLNALQFSRVAIVDTSALESTTMPYQNMVVGDLARMLAHDIAKAKLVVTKGDFITKFELNVLVMDHETFYKYVHKVAAKVQLDPHRYLLESLEP